MSSPLLSKLVDHPLARAFVMAAELLAFGLAIWAGFLAKSALDDQRLLNAYQILDLDSSSNAAKWTAARLVLATDGGLRGLRIRCEMIGEKPQPIDLYGRCATVDDLYLDGGEERIVLGGTVSPNTVFKGGLLRRVDMKIGDLRNSSFSGMTIYDSTFTGMKLHGVTFGLNPTRNGENSTFERPAIAQWWADRFSAIPQRVRPKIGFDHDDLSMAIITGTDLRDVNIKSSNVSSMVIFGKIDDDQFTGNGNFYFGDEAPQMVREGRFLIAPVADYSCPATMKYDAPTDVVDLESCVSLR